MPSYPVNIRRCQHIKVNGIQCGSPALRDEKCCYYHTQCRQTRLHVCVNPNGYPTLTLPEHEEDGALRVGTVTLPTLEDANSIQAGLADVMRLLLTNQIDHRTGALLLHALRTAAINVKFTSFEPTQPTHVVIDRESVAQRPLGATAWSMEEGRDYDEVKNDDAEKNHTHKSGPDKNGTDKSDADKSDAENEGARCMAALRRLTVGRMLDPDFLDRPHPNPEGAR